MYRLLNLILYLEGINMNTSKKILASDFLYESVNYGKFKVLEVKNSNDVEIEFSETGTKTKSSLRHIRTGKVKDKNKPNVCGVGYVGYGIHKPSLNGKPTNAYNRWTLMIKRCYSGNMQSTDNCYDDVKVCPEWHNFQNFAVWFEENYQAGLAIDKDLKNKGCKTYSPDNCIFIPLELNTLITLRKKTGKYNHDSYIKNRNKRLARAISNNEYPEFTSYLINHLQE